MSDAVVMWIVVILFVVMGMAATFTLTIMAIDMIKGWKKERHREKNLNQ